jgi:uncharacterized protein
MRRIGWAAWAGVAGCSGALPLGPAAEGVDRDGDGYAAGAGDCDDRDASVWPGGVDLPGDGMDQDCSGGDAAALPARALAPGDVVITEVMRDPVGVASDLGEWFELTNRLDVPVDLAGAQVNDLLTDDFLIARPLVIEAGGVVVLGGWDDPARNGGVEVDLRYPAGFGLTNAEDRIRLLVAGVLIDEVAWDASWPRRDGTALSLGSDSVDAEANDAVGAWCLADEGAVYGVGGRGSPGEGNPACPAPFEGLRVDDLEPGDLVISEVMQNPLAAGDDYGEWIEVYVDAPEPVDLWHLAIEDDSGDGFEVDAPLVVEPGSYVVFASFAEPSVNGGIEADAEWRWDFGLANSGDTVRLLAGTVTIDEIVYDNGLTFPDPEGASMSLDPGRLDADDNDAGSAWCTGGTPYGDGDLGTPGAANPPC